MKLFDAKVTASEPVATDYFRIAFDWPAGAGAPAPGRFLTVRIGTGCDPALRRPFAFSAYDPARGEASFIFQRRGRGTAWLASLAIGDALDVLGPLGAGFRPPARGSRPVLIGGGIGLGPMLYLATALGDACRRGECEAPILALGFRSAEFVPSVELPQGTVVCTDDGSFGFPGSAVDWLAAFDPGAAPSWYACGPAPMMAALDRLAAARSVPWQAATEQWMACGVGACMGCAVAMKDGSFLRACADGPVFDGSAVDWGRS